MIWTEGQLKAVNELIANPEKNFIDSVIIDTQGEFGCPGRYKFYHLDDVLAEVIVKLPELLRELEEKDRLIAMLVNDAQANIQIMKQVPNVEVAIQESQKVVAKAREALK